MSKKLSEMSLEELWQLFPIFLENHKTYWVDWYNEEEAQPFRPAGNRSLFSRASRKKEALR